MTREAGQKTEKSDDLEERLEFAIRTAKAAGDITLEYFSSSLSVMTKADNSPVTEADRRAENEIRQRILSRYPEDGLIGEEFGRVEGSSGRRWIIDPIDGTRSFILGVPFYGVLLGMEDGNEVSLGVVYLPALGEMVYAANGSGAWWLPAGHAAGASPRPARVSNVSRLSEGLFCHTCVKNFYQHNRGEAFSRMVRSVRLDRGFGDCYGYVLVATGRAEVMIDPIMSVWDCGPFPPILREAGGTFTDWTGRATIHGRDAISTNGRVFDEVMEQIKADKKPDPCR